MQGQHPRTPANAEVIDNSNPTPRSLEEMKATLSLVSDNLKKAQDKALLFANQRRVDVAFYLGDKVLIDTSAYLFNNGGLSPSKIKMPFLGPFSVVAKIGSTGYKLDLPAAIKFSPEFPATALLPYKLPFPHPQGFVFVLVVRGRVVEVESLLAHRINRRFKKPKRRHQFLVKWQGYDPSWNSWEPLELLLNNAFEYVTEYLESHQDLPEGETLATVFQEHQASQ